MRTVFKELSFNAPLGSYAVGGNADLPDWPQIFVGTSIEFTEQTKAYDLGELVITALSIEDSKATNTRVAANEKFQIVVGHYPNYALARSRPICWLRAIHMADRSRLLGSGHSLRCRSFRGVGPPAQRGFPAAAR